MLMKSNTKVGSIWLGQQYLVRGDEGFCSAVGQYRLKNSKPNIDHQNDFTQRPVL